MAEGPQEDLTRTDVAQPALFAVSMALAEVAGECGLRPDLVTGHSLGEYTAAAVSGALDPGDAMRLVCERGRLMAEIQERSPGAMAATGGVEEARLAELCAEAAEGQALGAANLNSPKQIVVSGEVAAVERLLALLDAEPGARGMRLPVGAAFHSSLMVPVREELRGPLGEVELSTPAIPLVANHSGLPVDDAEGVRTALIEQIAKPVRFADCVRSMVDAGCTSFLELGPGQGAHGAGAPGGRPRHEHGHGRLAREDRGLRGGLPEAPRIAAVRAELNVSDDPAGVAAEMMAAVTGHMVITGGSTPRERLRAAGGDARRTGPTWSSGSPTSAACHPSTSTRTTGWSRSRCSITWRAPWRTGCPASSGRARAPPSTSARSTRRSAHELPVFDFILLGLGPDAHTCSLFPGDDALGERERRVVGVERPGMAPLVARITLTLPVVNAAARRSSWSPAPTRRRRWPAPSTAPPTRARRRRWSRER